MGVGFLVLLSEAHAEAAAQVCRSRGIPTWVLGRVLPEADMQPGSAADVTAGAKGVAGGVVEMVGNHPTS